MNAKTSVWSDQTQPGNSEMTQQHNIEPKMTQLNALSNEWQTDRSGLSHGQYTIPNTHNILPHLTMTILPPPYLQGQPLITSSKQLHHLLTCQQVHHMSETGSNNPQPSPLLQHTVKANNNPTSALPDKAVSATTGQSLYEMMPQSWRM